jgi:hypothetical protein
VRNVFSNRNRAPPNGQPAAFEGGRNVWRDDGAGLFRAEGVHGIDGGGAARWQVAGQKGGQEKPDRN